ncbi:MAG: hypothetical protein ACTID3_18095 [Halomonas sp.]|uniref:hypothetical protein n=1 Tax=Halomonas sp. TaxID=1486246 RepID=UPI003F90BBD2
MNIIERTTAQLVRNRVHDLVDLAMDINANRSGKATVLVSPDGAHIGISSHAGDFHSSHPLKLIATTRTLDELENIIEDVRAFIGGAQ